MQLSTLILYCSLTLVLIGQHVGNSQGQFVSISYALQGGNSRKKSYFLILKICEAWHHAVVGVTDEEVVGVTGASLEQHHMRKRNNKIKAQLRKTFQNKLEQ